MRILITGITGATNIEMLSGLSPGQRVVTGPYETLRDLKDGAVLRRNPSQLTISSSGGSS
jgi:HlyD family secretion protein